MESNEKRVLVSPLNWGLGHATRCIPLINELVRQNVKVIIATDGDCLTRLQQEFPDLTYVQLPGIKIRYFKNLPMTLSMMLQLPSIINSINNENKSLKKIIDELNITHIISDNRYGIYSSQRPSVIITHQLQIKGGRYFKFIEPLILKINKLYISKFNELWIPDLPPERNLSGTLSSTHDFNIKVKYLGCLSRFMKDENKNANKKYNTIALLSGPEPQRSVIEKIILNYFHSENKPCLLIRGKPGQVDNFNTNENITTVDSISDEHFLNVLHPETILICRSGYSTLMDLFTLGHDKVVLIPTPGQTEQEYLAYRMKNKFHFYVHDQSQPLLIPDDYKGGSIPEYGQNNFLSDSIRNFLLQ